MKTSCSMIRVRVGVSLFAGFLSQVTKSFLFTTHHHFVIIEHLQIVALANATRCRTVSWDFEMLDSRPVCVSRTQPNLREATMNATKSFSNQHVTGA